MDPMDKMDPHSHEWEYISRKVLAEKLRGKDGGRAIPGSASQEPQ